MSNSWSAFMSIDLDASSQSAEVMPFAMVTMDVQIVLAKSSFRSGARDHWQYRFQDGERGSSCLSPR